MTTPQQQTAELRRALELVTARRLGADEVKQAIVDETRTADSAIALVRGLHSLVTGLLEHAEVLHGIPAESLLEGIGRDLAHMEADQSG
jgi:hypothetical protein